MDVLLLRANRLVGGLPPINAGVSISELPRLERGHPIKKRIRAAIVVTNILGHVTHLRNMQGVAEKFPDIEFVWIPVDPAEKAWWQRLRFLNHLSIKGSLLARGKLQAALAKQGVDVVLVHTHDIALFVSGLCTGIPLIISTDATPRQLAELRRTSGGGDGPVLAAYSWWVDQRVMAVIRKAQAMVAWSNWCERSFTGQYSVAPEKITVIPPGIDLGMWPYVERHPHGGKARLLFVGGEFYRKGGKVLIGAINTGLANRCEVDIVTREDLSRENLPSGARVHRNLNSNDGTLRHLYAEADVFVLPTLSDTLGIVLIEAMASGLPVVATDIAGVPEVVAHGSTGLLVRPGNTSELARAITELIDSPELRLKMGTAGRRKAAREFSAATNYGRLFNLLVTVARSRRGSLDL
ncbi:MAG: glycosyltransferase family 4 protein [Phycisphaerae bacterium]